MQEEKKFLEQYIGQSVDELISLSSKYCIDSIVLAFESALYNKEQKGEKLNKTELTIKAICSLEREVNNGGFHQFFLNTPEYAKIIVEALKGIGCIEIAKLTQKAINSLNADSLDIDSIYKSLDNEELYEALDILDEIYYTKIKEIPANALFEYIKKHKNDIKI